MTDRRLLIIDDELEFGESIRRVALKLNFAVEVTTSADEFKKTYKRFDPTVIVLDIVMPGVDGIELIQWLASCHYIGRILLISGFDPLYANTAEILGKSKGLLSIQRFPKPISSAALITALTASGPPI
jgi:DNA-binding response OmpR family regulator